MFRDIYALFFPPTQREIDATHISIETLKKHIRVHKIPGDIELLAACSYKEKSVRTLIHALKYGRQKHAARVVGSALADLLVEELYEKHIFNAVEKPLLIPVPLSRRRMYERGFNQSEVIARAVVDACPDDMVSYAHNVVKRVKNTKQQTQIQDKHARIQNMQGAFAVTRPDMVRNRDIVLIDDVITTGATMHDLARALKHAGARSVMGVALAH